jgi:hypothetical protein
MLCDGIQVDVVDRNESPLTNNSNYTVLIHAPETARSQMAEAVYQLITERLEERSAPRPSE